MSKCQNIKNTLNNIKIKNNNNNNTNDAVAIVMLISLKHASHTQEITNRKRAKNNEGNYQIHVKLGVVRLQKLTAQD